MRLTLVEQQRPVEQQIRRDALTEDQGNDQRETSDEETEAQQPSILVAFIGKQEPCALFHLGVWPGKLYYSASLIEAGWEDTYGHGSIAALDTPYDNNFLF